MATFGSAQLDQYPSHDYLCTFQLHSSSLPDARGEFDPDSDVIRAYCQEILSTVKEVINLNPMLIGRLTFFSERTIDVNNPFKLADFAASISAGNPEKLQAVLAEESAEGRLRLALDIVSKVNVKIYMELLVYDGVFRKNNFRLALGKGWHESSATTRCIVPLTLYSIRARVSFLEGVMKVLCTQQKYSAVYCPFQCAIFLHMPRV